MSPRERLGALFAAVSLANLAQSVAREVAGLGPPGYHPAETLANAASIPAFLLGVAWTRRNPAVRRVLPLAFVVYLLAVLVWTLHLLFPVSAGAFVRGRNPALLAQGFHGEQSPDLLELRLMPYTGYHFKPDLKDAEWRWDDGSVSRYSSNNLGFWTPYTLDPAGLTAPPELRGARVVVLTGGSAALGLGASSNATTIAAVLEELLEAAGGATPWRVVNLAMGSWIAYQELIALDLYGDVLAPSWIVTFDGRNDVLVPTWHGEGVPHYYHFGGQRRLNELFVGAPALGPIDRLLPFLAHRRLHDRLADVSRRPEPDVGTPELERAAAFYLRAQRSMALRFRSARLLLALQPTRFTRDMPLRPYATMFGSAYPVMRAGLEQLDREHEHVTALDLSDLPFPGPLPRFFRDDCHLTDEGQREVAARLAAAILREEAARPR